MEGGAEGKRPSLSVQSLWLAPYLLASNPDLCRAKPKNQLFSVILEDTKFSNYQQLTNC
jgi:hypothetical protein